MREAEELERACAAFASGNYVLARQLFKRLQSNQCARAHLYLGWMCAGGLGGPESRDEAECHYRALADTGDLDGKYFLGASLHARGDYHSAVSQYQEAADLGHVSAAYWTYWLYNNELNQDIDSEDRARKYLIKAYQLGHIFARRDLAIQDITNGKTFGRRLLARVRYWWIVMKGFILAIRNVEDPRVR